SIRNRPDCRSQILNEFVQVVIPLSVIQGIVLMEIFRIVRTGLNHLQHHVTRQINCELRHPVIQHLFEIPAVHREAFREINHPAEQRAKHHPVVVGIVAIKFRLAYTMIDKGFYFLRYLLVRLADALHVHYEILKRGPGEWVWCVPFRPMLDIYWPEYILPQPEIIPGCFEIKVVTDRVVLPTILSKDADADQVNEVPPAAE